MTDSIAARVAALPKTPTPELKRMWRELYDREPPGFSRNYLISRLAYRIQELAYGGLKPATRAKLDALAEGLDPKAARKRVINGPVVGTQLIREWRGVEHKVTAGRRLQVGRAPVQKPERRRARDHRHSLERAHLLRREAPWRRRVSPRPARKLRCAVYTRKSSEEGLEQEFNSLHAQREAGLAYIASQKSEGWIACPDHYDDGGISGGTLERPALKRLLCDIEAGLIDVVVVYKIDRLSRSLTVFARLVDVFERHNVTFVSVTQQFNTTTSMGRLTLNILLSFAQFEREVIGERIRDKFAASRKKGMWMGGWPPLGYEVQDRRLVVVEREAALVRRIFDRFAKTGSALAVARELNAAGEVTKCRQCANGTRGGKPWTKGAVYKVLANRIYLARPCTRALHTLANTRRSSTSVSGTRRTPSWPSRRTAAGRRPGLRCLRS
jgi:DNA invertase Pin-like site-specific DNA recombinase